MRTVVAVRLPEAVLTWLDTRAKALAREQSGVAISRGDAIRHTLLRAMQAEQGTPHQVTPTHSLDVPLGEPSPGSQGPSSPRDAHDVQKPIDWRAKLAAEEATEIAKAEALGFSKRGEPGQLTLEKLEGGWRAQVYQRASGKRWGWFVFRASETAAGNDSPHGKSYSIDRARKAALVALRKALQAEPTQTPIQSDT